MIIFKKELQSLKTKQCIQGNAYCCYFKILFLLGAAQTKVNTWFVSLNSASYLILSGKFPARDIA